MAKAILFTLIILFSLSGTFLRAQPTNSPANHKNGIVIEILGNAPLLSLNYTRQILQFKKLNTQRFGFLDIGVGIGLEITDLGFFGGSTEVGPTFPHHLTANFGKKNHFLEIGYGGVVANKIISSKPYIFTPLLGWRFISPNNVFFRLHFSPWMYDEIFTRISYDQNGNPVEAGNYTVHKFRPMGGISIGRPF